MSRIRELRKEKQLSQEELGKLLNVQKAAISKYERGLIEPSKSVLLKMSEIFNVSIDYLLGLSDERNLSNTSPKSSNTLSTKNERDVSKTLEELKTNLESQSGLLFSGGELDEETREFLLASLERTIRQSKVLAKEKFTPHKYKK